MMSIHFFGLFLLFFKFHHNFCNSNIDNFFKGYVKCNNFSTNKFLTSNSYIYGEFSNVAISLHRTQAFYPAQYVFIILVPLFMNIRFLKTALFIIYLM